MKHDFFARIPADVRGRLSLAPQGCGCTGGWVQTPQGSRRCPQCQLTAQEERLGRAGIRGTRYDKTWSAMRLRHESWGRVAEVSRGLPSLVGEGRGLGLIGLPGTGTTQAAALLVRGAVEAGFGALLVSWPAWVEEVQANYTRRLRTQAEHVADLERPALLALDAVGEASTKGGDLERKLFERVLGARYAAGRSTVITAGMTLRELEDVMGERAFDRFRHSAEWVVFDGPNEREEEERLRSAALPPLQLDAEEAS